MPKLADLLAEYETLKRQKINPLERAGDWISGVDERLDFLMPKLLETLIHSEEAHVEILKVKNIIAQLPGGEEVMPTQTEQIVYQYDLAIAGAALSAVRLVEVAPFSGFIELVTMHYPDGVDALVDIKIGVKQTQFIPRDGWLSLNDATPQFHPHWWADEDDQIWVEMQNRDGGNTHNISVILDIRGLR